jgi:hypothetical protein
MNRSTAHLAFVSGVVITIAGCAKHNVGGSASSSAPVRQDTPTSQTMPVSEFAKETKAAPTVGAPESSQPAPSGSVIASIDASDRDVLDAVLSDLLTQGDTPIGVQKAPPKSILLSADPATYPQTAKAVLMRHDKKLWDALSPEQIAAATEAADQLVERHKRGDALPAEPSRDDRVKLQPGPPPKFNPLDMKTERPVVAYPPGYTKNGEVAVVSLILPWSMHHADATYILARDGERWKIILRQFVYYA